MMKKLKIKAQDFTLPLIQQKLKNSIQMTKSNLKKTRQMTNESNLNTKRKQKEQSRPSILRKQVEKVQKNMNQKNNKSKSLKKTEQNSESENDFEQKIKQNKRLLKSNKIKKENQLKLNYHSNQNIEKENILSTTKLPFINSLPLKKSSTKIQKKNYYEDIKLTKNLSSNLKRSLSNNQEEHKNPKLHTSLIDNKNCSDIFEDIHNFLQNVNYLKPNKCLKADKIYEKLQQYKQKLRKIDPNQSIDDLNKSRQAYSALKFQSQTVSEWKKINVSQKIMQKISSSFREQLQKIRIYFNRTSITLDQLLEHRKEILDLVLLKKIKQKNTEKSLISNKKRISEFADEMYS